MILKLNGLVLTRYTVEQLAKEHSDVTEIDFSEAKVYSASAMHQIVSSFPEAKMTGLEGYNKEQYDWIIEVINSAEFKRNRRSLFDETESQS